MCGNTPSKNGGRGAKAVRAVYQLLKIFVLPKNSTCQMDGLIIYFEQEDI